MITEFIYHNIQFKAYYNPDDNSGLAAIVEIVTRNDYILSNFSAQENKIFIDIGANIGIATIIMAKLNPKSIIYSFEPSNDTYNILLKNIEVNNLTNVRPFRLAVSNKLNKTLTLSILDRMSGASSTYSDIKSFSDFYNIKPITETITCISLDEIIVKEKIEEIYLLKIDCEGAEFDIIYDSIMFKKKIIKNMVGEFHDLKYNTIDKKSKELLKYCKEYIDGVLKVTILQL